MKKKNGILSEMLIVLLFLPLIPLIFIAIPFLYITETYYPGSTGLSHYGKSNVSIINLFRDIKEAP